MVPCDGLYADIDSLKEDLDSLKKDFVKGRMPKELFNWSNHSMRNIDNGEKTSRN